MSTSISDFSSDAASEVLAAFSLPPEVHDLRQIDGGRSNETWLVVLRSAERVVIQRSARPNPHLEPCSIFANQLHAGGVHCIEYFVRGGGQHVYEHASKAFRIMPALLGGLIKPNPDETVLALLWDVYASIKDKARCVSVSLPPFDTSEFFVKRLLSTFNELVRDGSLSSLQDALPFEIGQIAAGLTQLQHGCLERLEPSHGDLNIRNFLVVDGMPRLIDFENCAMLPVWHDLGDIVRSWCSDKDGNAWLISKQKLSLIAAKISDSHKIGSDEAMHILLQAGLMVTSKLCVHLANDYCQKAYYSHNRNQSECLPETSRIIRSQYSLIQSLRNLL